MPKSMKNQCKNHTRNKSKQKLLERAAPRTPSIPRRQNGSKYRCGPPRWAPFSLPFRFLDAPEAFHGGKMAPKNSCAAHPFGSLFATFSKERFFNAFWSPFGSLWVPFGSLSMPFGSLLVPLGSLLLPLALDFLTFGVSWRHFKYLCVFAKKILCNIIFFTEAVPKGNPKAIPSNLTLAPPTLF